MAGGFVRLRRLRPPRVIDALTAQPAGAVQAANGQAAALGAQINPFTRDPNNPVLGAAGVGGPEPQLVSQYQR